MSTPYRRTQQLRIVLRGNWAIGLHARPLVVVAHNIVMLFAIKPIRVTFREMSRQTNSLIIIIIIYLKIQELWTMKIAGQMRTTLNRAINFANVMRIRVRLIGGLVHGNCVRSRVESTVR